MCRIHRFAVWSFVFATLGLGAAQAQPAVAAAAGVALTASNATPRPGASVDLTATSDQPVPSGYFLQIVDQRFKGQTAAPGGSGNAPGVQRSCPGSPCLVTISPSSPPAPRTFFARISLASGNDIKGESPPVTITWTASAPPPQTATQTAPAAPPVAAPAAPAAPPSGGSNVPALGPATSPSNDPGPVLSAGTDDEFNRALRFMNGVTTKPVDATKFRDLVLDYRDGIPVGAFGKEEPPLVARAIRGATGLMTPGQLNNLVFGENETACGGYQGSVLKLLLAKKFSADPAARAQLDGFEFGPIQIEAGGHQAVVLFPKGTDWRLSGVVLDPWIEQRPQLYPIEEWQKKFALGGTAVEGSVGNSLVPISANTGLFPTTPGADGEWAYQDVFSNGATRPTPRPAKRKVLGVGSPVAVLVRSADGRQAGMKPDGAIVNDFGAGADIAIIPSSAGVYTATFMLPDGDYSVAMTATSAGSVHVWNHLAGAPLSEFDPVDVARGDVLQLQWEGARPAGSLSDAAGRPVKSHAVTDSGGRSPASYALPLGAALGGLVVATMLLIWRRRPRQARP